MIFKITDYIEPDLEWEEKECEKLGVDFTHYQMKDADAAEIIQNVQDAEIILVNMAKFNTKVIDSLPNLKVLIRHGIGYDNVDVPTVTGQGIIFANEATASSVDVAEHAIMLMFGAYRKIRLQNEIVQESPGNAEYEFRRTNPLYRIEGKFLGIVGCGNIGSVVLRKIKSFGFERILVCDPYLSDDRLVELGIVHTPLEELLRLSDIVTIHVPLNDETRHLFNYDRFASMKKTAVIVNTARGPIVHTDDLARALDDGLIAGAGLDVMEPEPPTTGCRLLDMGNAVLTPHHAWYSEEGGWDIRHMIIDDLKAVLDGKLPRHVVNPEVLDKPNLRIQLGK
ncbi:C-terminal binding protein [Candidatus Latescibacterota bacterium]